MLDVLIDNATRGWAWCGALPGGGGGAALLLLETTCFAFTHAVREHRVLRMHSHCLWPLPFTACSRCPNNCPFAAAFLKSY